jgi:tetratricopeptide (TPR) repeat protein
MDTLNTDSQVVRLCIQITQAEFAGRLDEARTLAIQAWEAATDDFEACMAAHYVARFQTQPEEIFHWNEIALQRANACERWQVESFYPSLYVNMGYAYEQMGNLVEAEKYYALAEELGVQHERN